MWEREPVPSLKRKVKQSVAWDVDLGSGGKHLYRCPLSGEPSALSFIESSGGRGVPKTLRQCLRGEGAVGVVEVAVATCICECQPSVGCRGDGTVKDPGSCDERVIPCGQRTGVVPLLTDGARGLVRTWLRGVDKERIIPSPRKPRRGGCRLVSRGASKI
jgi:hypothetical protein